MLWKPALSLLAFAACGGGNPGLTDAPPDAPPPECASWRQWGNSATHAGASCVAGQPLQNRLADVVYDPYLAQEVTDARGDLLVHYQTPLIDGDDLFMMTKKGTYTACNVGIDGPSCDDPDELYRLSSQVWAEQRFAIATDGSLALQWSYDSDWKPEPQTGFEPMFQPALAGTLIAIPGAGGALWELDAQSGRSSVTFSRSARRSIPIPTWRAASRSAPTARSTTTRSRSTTPSRSRCRPRAGSSRWRPTARRARSTTPRWPPARRSRPTCASGPTTSTSRRCRGHRATPTAA